MGEIKGRTFDLLTLGQLLLRLSPPDNDRLSRGDTFVKQVGGAELKRSSWCVSVRPSYRCYLQTSVT
mgnify:CR=1 FL=1